MSEITFECTVKNIDRHASTKIIKFSKDIHITVHNSCDIAIDDNVRITLSNSYNGSVAYAMHGYVYMKTDYGTHSPKTFVSCGGLLSCFPKEMNADNYYIIIDKKKKTKSTNEISERITRSKRS